MAKTGRCETAALTFTTRWSRRKAQLVSVLDDFQDVWRFSHSTVRARVHGVALRHGDTALTVHRGMTTAHRERATAEFRYLR